MKEARYQASKMTEEESKVAPSIATQIAAKSREETEKPVASAESQAKLQEMQASGQTAAAGITIGGGEGGQDAMVSILRQIASDISSMKAEISKVSSTVSDGVGVKVS